MGGVFGGKPKSPKPTPIPDPEPLPDPDAMAGEAALRRHKKKSGMARTFLAGDLEPTEGDLGRKSLLGG